MSQHNTFSDEDIQLWRELTKSVTKTAQPEEPPQKPLYIDEVKPRVNYQNIPNIYQLDELRVNQLDNIDGSLAKRFRRCELPIEAKLDLHGKKENEAFAAVEEFIRSAYLQNKRCVIIITGKGLNPDEQDIFSTRGKLKERTPQWLNSAELRPLILGFIHPNERLGGSGALYILLRKKK